MLRVPRYRPFLAGPQLPCPWLVCIADRDDLTPPEIARELAQAAGAEVRGYDLGHFDIYRGAGFEQVVADQVAFLERHLVREKMPEVDSRPRLRSMVRPSARLWGGGVTKGRGMASTRSLLRHRRPRRRARRARRCPRSPQAAIPSIPNGAGGDITCTVQTGANAGPAPLLGHLHDLRRRADRHQRRLPAGAGERPGRQLPDRRPLPRLGRLEARRRRRAAGSPTATPSSR